MYNCLVHAHTSHGQNSFYGYYKGTILGLYCRATRLYMKYHAEVYLAHVLLSSIRHAGSCRSLLRPLQHRALWAGCGSSFRFEVSISWHSLAEALHRRQVLRCPRHKASISAIFLMRVVWEPRGKLPVYKLRTCKWQLWSGFLSFYLQLALERGVSKNRKGAKDRALTRECQLSLLFQFGGSAVGIQRSTSSYEPWPKLHKQVCIHIYICIYVHMYMYTT